MGCRSVVHLELAQGRRWVAAAVVMLAAVPRRGAIHEGYLRASVPAQSRCARVRRRERRHIRAHAQRAWLGLKGRATAQLRALPAVSVEPEQQRATGVRIASFACAAALRHCTHRLAAWLVVSAISEAMLA